jgi:predicted ATP-grasp superfamily ATP-dependent carboligase
LFARRNVVIPARFSDAALAEALFTPWPTLADIPPAGTRIEEGHPVLTHFAEGSTVDEVERKLRDRIAELERKLDAASGIIGQRRN